MPFRQATSTQKVAGLQLAAAAGLMLLGGLSGVLSASAQSNFHPEPPHYHYETPMPPLPPPPPARVPEPPIVITPPVSRPPIIPPRIDVPRGPVPVNPKDLVATSISTIGQSNGTALKGITALQESSFPSGDMLNGSADFTVVRAREGSDYSKVSPYAVELKSGQILVSVRKPSKLALITCQDVHISAGADSDVLFSFENGLARVVNLTGRTDAVKIMLKNKPEEGSIAGAYSIKPGYEFIYRASGRLSHQHIRIADGMARRHVSLVENGFAAVAELSVESALKNCDLIAVLQQSDSGVKEKRILSDMSKMAAVLNYINGEGGYKQEPQATLEMKKAAIPSHTN